MAYADSAGKFPEVVENREGSRFTPAVVGFKSGVDPFVGLLARAQRFEAPRKTLVGMQPLLGLGFSDPSASAIAQASGASGPSGLGGEGGVGGLVEGEGGAAGVATESGGGGAIFSGEEAARLMLSSMRELAEHKVGGVKT
ncbi:unnamed protein product [Discosporangium mesarthrocarpum]